MGLATVTDALLAAAWLGVVLDNRRMLRREAGARARESGPTRAVAAAVLAALLGGTALLERLSGGRVGFHPLAAGLGVGCAAAGLALHMRARRTLGVQWSSRVAVAPGHRLVTAGPYAWVRHPIYLAVLLLAAGTVLAHPSVATVCLAGGFAAGVAIKIRAEERVLRNAGGEAWARYAARVPALLPCPTGLVSRAWR